MFINPFKINEPVHVYYLCQFICEIVGLVVVSSNTKAVGIITVKILDYFHLDIDVTCWT